MAKLKSPNKGLDESEQTIQERDISPNTSINAQANTTTDIVVDTTSDTIPSDPTEPKTNGAPPSDPRGEDGVGAEVVTSKQAKKEKLPTAKGVAKSDEERVDSFTMEVLKAYSNYPSLYVDKFGCAYTPDTPKAIRGCTTLYQNPHFKSDTTWH